MGLASELEGDLLDGCGLGELELYVPAEEGGVDVDAGAAEAENIAVDVNLEVGVSVQLFLVWHVASVVARVVSWVELWGRGEDGIGVEGPQSSMEGGGQRVFLWRRGRRRGAVEYIRHGEKKQRRKTERTQAEEMPPHGGRCRQPATQIQRAIYVFRERPLPIVVPRSPARPLSSASVPPDVSRR